ncbi:hypothetical protein Tco_0455814 [Tanacetum coccineum]
MEESLSKFIVEYAKRHEENSNLIKEIRAATDSAIRNQGASIKALEIQIGQMSKMRVVVVSVVTWWRGWWCRGGDSGRATEMAAGGDVCRVEAAWWTWRRWWWFEDGDDIKTMRVVVVLYRGGVGDVVFRWTILCDVVGEGRVYVSTESVTGYTRETSDTVCCTKGVIRGGDVVTNLDYTVALLIWRTVMGHTALGGGGVLLRAFMEVWGWFEWCHDVVWADDGKTVMVGWLRWSDLHGGGG